nr:hotdog fold thioesterase [Pseudomonas aeruginosa]
MNAAQVQALIRMGLPMAEDIDFRVERLDERHALARIPFHGKLVRPGGTLSGPTIMALADAAMYAVILGRLGAVEMAVTSNLNINFLSKPRPEDLLAEASILKLGRRQVVCEVGVFSQSNEEDLVAHVTGTYALPLLADAAMYAVILGRLGAVEMAVTSNLNINFLSKPRPEDLLAEASILKLGRRQVVCEVGVFSQSNEEDLVAHVTGTYALPL